MNQFEKMKSGTKETLDNLVAQGKEQPESVQKWGVTGAAAVGGAVVISAAAKGILGIVATLAKPPVALTVGALGGGLLGWNYIQKQLSGSAEESDEQIIVPNQDTITTDTSTAGTSTTGTSTVGASTAGTTGKPVTTTAGAAEG